MDYKANIPIYLQVIDDIKKRILTASAVCTDPADLSHVDAGTGRFRCDVVFL